MRMIDADRFGEIMEQWKKDCLADNDTQSADIISDVILQLDDMPALAQPNEPLTWEEFEAMIDKPVYIIELETRSYWALVHQVSDAGVRLTSAIDLHDYGSRGLYGKTWIAYAYPPARIDREAWKQCRECAPNCFWCQNNNEGKKTVPEVCKECKNHNNYEHDPDYKFCPECGRPLTDEAWDELEKRLGG